MKRVATSTLFFFSISLFAVNTTANGDNKHVSQQHEAHVHGTATLNIVLEASELLLELETPAMNVLGFEHRPKTDEQQAMLAKAEIQFGNAPDIIKLNHGSCDLKSVDVESPDFPLKEDSSEDEQRHIVEEGGHSEFHVIYIFTCSDVEKLESIEVRLFDTFPGFKEIDAQWIFDSEQGVRKLTPSFSNIKLH